MENILDRVCAALLPHAPLTIDQAARSGGRIVLAVTDSNARIARLDVGLPPSAGASDIPQIYLHRMDRLGEHQAESTHWGEQETQPVNEGLIQGTVAVYLLANLSTWDMYSLKPNRLPVYVDPNGALHISLPVEYWPNYHGRITATFPGDTQSTGIASDLENRRATAWNVVDYIQGEAADLAELQRTLDRINNNYACKELGVRICASRTGRFIFSIWLWVDRPEAWCSSKHRIDIGEYSSLRDTLTALTTISSLLYIVARIAVLDKKSLRMDSTAEPLPPDAFFALENPPEDYHKEFAKMLREAGTFPNLRTEFGEDGNALDIDYADFIEDPPLAGE